MDACTLNGLNGIGYYATVGTLPVFYGMDSLYLLTDYHTSEGAVRQVDINVLEFAVSIFALTAAIRYLRSTPSFLPSFSSLYHVHVWSDNTSCVSWMSNHRAVHPLHSFLLQVLSHLQRLSHVVLTQAWIQGEANSVADAISRHFNCPAGPAVKASLASVHVMPCFPAFIAHMVRLSRTPLMDAFALAADARTAAAGLLGQHLDYVVR
jgi:hypothetical protein